MRELLGVKATKEITVVVLVAVVTLILASALGISDAFASWAQRNRGWGADGLIPALLVLVFGFSWLAVRRWRETVRDLEANRAAEDLAKQQEARYRVLFEEALNPIFLMDPKGQYKEANSSALRFLECDKEDLPNKGIWDFKPANRSLDMQHSSTPVGVRCTLETKYQVDGRVKTLMLNMVPLKLGDEPLLFGIGQEVTTQKEAEREQEVLIRQLQDTLSHTKVLRGLLPICANCKRIRDERGYWHSVERYISERLDVRFTHGVCPECMRTLYGDLMKD